MEDTIVKRYTCVLAAIDFSKPARDAFDFALALSARHGAELVVVHAVPVNQSFGWLAEERRALMASLRRRAEAAGVAFHERIQHGPPADVILSYAEALRADVIVVGTNQRRGIERLRAGSVGERITGRATVPVMVIPRRRRAGVERPFRHVAVAIDFSANARRMFEHALAVANEPGDRVTVLHVVPGFSSGVPPHLYRYGVAEYQHQLVRDAERRLSTLVPAAGSTPATIETRVLHGDTTTEINGAVERIGADLLVVGAASRGGLSRALFGTTAARLLRVSGVPMLAVPELAGRQAASRRAVEPLAA